MAIKFDLDNIASKTHIEKATLRIYKTGNHKFYASARNIYVNTFSKRWDANFVSWKSASSGNLWNNIGGDFSVSAVDVVLFGDKSKNGWYEFDVTLAVKKMVELPETDFGFLLHNSEGSDTKDATVNMEMYFASADNADTKKRPQLVIDTSSTVVVGTPKKGNLEKTISIKKLGDRWLYFSQKEDIIEVSLYNAHGQCIWYRDNMAVRKGQNTLVIPKLSTGLFFAVIKNITNGKKEYLKIY